MAFRLIRIAGKGLAALIFLLFAFALAVAIWPGVLINDHTLEIARRIVNRRAIAGLNVKWDSLHIEWKSLGLLRKQARITSSKFCLVRAKEVDFCARQLDVSAAASFAGFRPVLEEAGPVTIEGGTLFLDLSHPEAAGQKPRPGPKKTPSPALFATPRWAHRTVLKPVVIRLEHWRVRTRDEVFEGVLDLASHSEGRLARIRLNAEAISPGNLQGVLALELENQDGFRRLEGWLARTRGSLKLIRAGARIGWDGEIRSRLPDGENPELDYRLQGSFREGVKVIVAHADGSASLTAIRLRLEGSARELAAGVPSFHVSNCDASLVRSSVEQAGGVFHLDCPVEVEVPMPPRGLRQSVPGLRIPTEAGVRLVADLSTSSFIPNSESRVQGRVDATLRPILTPLFEGSGSLSSQVDGELGRFPEEWKLDSEVAAAVRVPEFQKIVELLRHTDWAVPAPLLVMSGPAEFSTRGTADLLHADADVRWTTRFRSEIQTLDLDGSGKVALERGDPKNKLNVNAALILTNVRLELPRLGLEAPPRLLPDSRIHTIHQGPSPDEIREKNSWDVRWNVSVRTPSGHPVQLVSNLAKAPVPIRLDLVVSPEGPRGTLGIEEFPLELFRRNAKVRFFHLNLSEPMDGSEIDGLVEVSYTDYKIDVLLLGTVGKPQIRLRSDPPLPEEQLVAVLLFGQPLEQLDPEQSASIGNTRAAFTEGALGLASLYLLASTPVQSVGYDPQTGQVSAKVRLGEGTSLNLGADPSQLQSVGIRRRLSSRWSVTTELVHPGDSVERRVSAFLEWNYRY